ncbi:thiopeptide-type bacteriocin biosynthesis protein [Streptomyces rectiverticillatus]|uniref:thiopeptide-type bacteriocin biosynthesis protein n=1 Tax=Streptomyces rectiverticillatus TaxID=173860 RepID=UPI0015C3DC80|nr:thiopeptide-type bacteriocin biosynthesis protein [Streptomyces rectiverticillatus]
METDWLYYRIFAEHRQGVQQLLDGPVREIVAEGRRLCPGHRWFFIRYFDKRGPQIRLRQHGPLDALAELERLAGSVLERAGRADGVAGYTGFVPGLYEPETAKYGAGNGIERAEEVFRASSELALRFSGPRHTPLRLGHAIVATASAMDILPPAQRVSFLYNMRWYWSGRDGRAAEEQRHRIRSAAIRNREALEARFRMVHGGPQAQAQAVQEYTDLLRETLRTPFPGRRTVPYLLFHFAHLMNNRLGLLPAEEALVAEFLLTSSWPTMDDMLGASPPGLRPRSPDTRPPDQVSRMMVGAGDQIAPGAALQCCVVP